MAADSGRTEEHRASGRSGNLVLLGLSASLVLVTLLAGILAALVLPGLRNPPVRAKEAALKTNLRNLRDAIDQHYADKGAYPPALEVLVVEGYVFSMPVDPMTGQADWVEKPCEQAAGTGCEKVAGSGIVDVHSASEAISSLDGRPYSEW